MRTMWLVVDDPDGFDDPQPWEVQDPEPWEPIETADEITVEIGTAPPRYVGRHRA